MINSTSFNFIDDDVLIPINSPDSVTFAIPGPWTLTNVAPSTNFSVDFFIEKSTNYNLVINNYETTQTFNLSFDQFKSIKVLNL